MTTSLNRPIANNVSRRKRASILRFEYDHFRSCGMPHVYTMHHLMQVYGLTEDVIRLAARYSPYYPDYSN